MPGKAYNPLQVSPELYEYVIDTSIRENEIANELRLETEQLPNGVMLSDLSQVQFLSILLKSIGAKRGIEGK